MRILMAPLVGAFLFLGGCAHHGNGIVHMPDPVVPPAHHVVHKKHHTKPVVKPVVQPAPVQVEPQSQPMPPEPPYVQQVPESEVVVPDPYDVPPPVAKPATKETPWAAYLGLILAGIAALSIVFWIIFHFIRGFLAARKGQS